MVVFLRASLVAEILGGIGLINTILVLIPFRDIVIIRGLVNIHDERDVTRILPVITECVPPVVLAVRALRTQVTVHPHRAAEGDRLAQGGDTIIRRQVKVHVNPLINLRRHGHDAHVVAHHEDRQLVLVVTLELEVAGNVTRDIVKQLEVVGDRALAVRHHQPGGVERLVHRNIVGTVVQFKTFQGHFHAHLLTVGREHEHVLRANRLGLDKNILAGCVFVHNTLASRLGSPDARHDVHRRLLRHVLQDHLRNLHVLKLLVLDLVERLVLLRNDEVQSGKRVLERKLDNTVRRGLALRLVAVHQVRKKTLRLADRDRRVRAVQDRGIQDRGRSGRFLVLGNIVEQTVEVQTLAMAVQADGIIADLMHPIGHRLDTFLGDVLEARGGGLGGVHSQQRVLRARREVDLVDVRAGEDLLTEG